MLDRCRDMNPEKHNYASYAGKGITVCDRWEPRRGGSFENFLADMGERPEGKHPSGYALYSLDRRDNNGNYCPENCRWADSHEQMMNRRQKVPLDVITAAAFDLLEPEQAEALLALIADSATN